MSPVTCHVVNTRLEVLEANWAKFQAEHDIIYHEATNQLEEQSYIKNKIYERCQKFNVQARATLLVQQEEIEGINPSSRSSHSSVPQLQSVNHRRSLPRIDLLKFSGDYNKWKSFHDLFSSLVERNVELNNVKKMHYLKTCLIGEAAEFVNNLSISENIFSIAWEALISL